MKLNLGCGKDIKEEYENYDIEPVDDRVKYIDLRKPLPFDDDSISEILLDNVIEHIKNLDDLMIELRRVLKKKGEIHIFVPYFSQPSAFKKKHYHLFNLSNKVEFLNGLKIKKLDLIFLFENKFFPLIIIEWFPKLVYKIAPSFYEWYISRIFPASNLYLCLTK
jgi:ubiquinone/menaquinone biosynthesis C-methylase UbiE